MTDCHCSDYYFRLQNYNFQFLFVEIFLEIFSQTSVKITILIRSWNLNFNTKKKEEIILFLHLLLREDYFLAAFTIFTSQQIHPIVGNWFYPFAFVFKSRFSATQSLLTCLIPRNFVFGPIFISDQFLLPPNRDESKNGINPSPYYITLRLLFLTTTILRHPYSMQIPLVFYFTREEDPI